jgi:hypothetical protein
VLNPDFSYAHRAFAVRATHRFGRVSRAPGCSDSLEPPDAVRSSDRLAASADERRMRE